MKSCTSFEKFLASKNVLIKVILVNNNAAVHPL